MLVNVRLAAVVLTLLSCITAGCSRGPGPTPLQQRMEKVEIIEKYWPDGTLRLRKRVLSKPDPPAPQPLNHGTYTTWHDNGLKAYEAVFVRGKIHGVETHWHKNGQKWTEARYVDGLRHGPRTSWDETGRKRKEEHFFEDKPHGTWTIWREDGRINWQQRFEHGIPMPRDP